MPSTRYSFAKSLLDVTYTKVCSWLILHTHNKLSSTMVIIPWRPVHSVMMGQKNCSSPQRYPSPDSPPKSTCQRHHCADLARHPFTVNRLSFAERSYLVAALQQRYQHSQGILLSPTDHAQLLLLLGSDLPHLSTPVEPICKGPQEGPIAVHTQFSWALQGPISPL